MTDPVDPGWKPALPALIPLFGRVVAVRRPAQIVVTRALWLAFASSLVWIGLVVALLMSGTEPKGSVGTGAAIVGIATVIGVIGTTLARRRRRNVDPDSNDVGVYRSYFFVCIVFSELAALAGFVAAFVVSRPTPYYLGGAIALLGFAVVAPTRRFVAAQGPAFKTAMLAPPGR